MAKSTKLIREYIPFGDFEEDTTSSD